MPQYIYIDLSELITYHSVYEYLSRQFEVDLPYNQNMDALYDKISEKYNGQDVIIKVSLESQLANEDSKVIKTLNFFKKISQIDSHYHVYYI